MDLPYYTLQTTFTCSSHHFIHSCSILLSLTFFDPVLPQACYTHHQSDLTFHEPGCLPCVEVRRQVVQGRQQCLLCPVPHMSWSQNLEMMRIHTSRNYVIIQNFLTAECEWTLFLNLHLIHVICNCYLHLSHRNKIKMLSCLTPTENVVTYRGTVHWLL